MLQHEFEERVNLALTADYYNYVIDPLYMSSKKEKDEFCKEWLNTHIGINQDEMSVIMTAFNYDCLPLIKEENEAKKVAREQRKEEDKYLYSLIFLKACLTGDKELRDAYILKYGKRDWLRRKLTEDMELTEDERKSLATMLTA